MSACGDCIAIPPKLPIAKAGPIGPGSGVLLTELPLSKYTKQSPQALMRSYWSMALSVPWVTLAEDAISERFSSVDWHLEDDQDVEVDDTYPNPDAQAARMLLGKP